METVQNECGKNRLPQHLPLHKAPFWRADHGHWFSLDYVFLEIAHAYINTSSIYPCSPQMQPHNAPLHLAVSGIVFLNTLLLQILQLIPILGRIRPIFFLVQSILHHVTSSISLTFQPSAPSLQLPTPPGVGLSWSPPWVLLLSVPQSGDPCFPSSACQYHSHL